MDRSISLYNTLTRGKQTFVPLDPARVRLYVCGPTVYDYAHIGNARPVIVFDLLFRLLRAQYGAEHVVYVRNITDVDDKINERAARDFPDRPLNEAIRQVTRSTTAQFHHDVAALGCLPPTIEPRATDHITQMCQIIERLVAGGFAYVAEGHVLFSPAAMDAKGGDVPRYGALANRSLDEMVAGARVDVAPYKRDATDFVLWKPSNADEPGWPSPCGLAGRGRPGWHIECSAMSWTHLGEVFDLHGGGIDLVFPHHENEIAQSTCAFGHHVMANIFMHNGFLQVEGQKMSKSLGNFITIHQLLATQDFGGRSWSGAVLRLAMLRTHYRQPIDFTVKALEEADATLHRWHDHQGFAAFDVADHPVPSPILEALRDDLNTAEVVMHLHALQKNADIAGLKSALLFLGLYSDALAHQPVEALSQEVVAEVDAVIARRIAARNAKDWAESDRLRDQLLERGIVLKDSKAPDGSMVTTWELKR